MKADSTKISFLHQTYRNVLTGWISIGLVAIVNIFLIPVILNNAGKEMYGLWLLVFNTLNYFYIADFGITNAITRIYAKYNVNNKSHISKLISTSYCIVFLIDAILVSALFFLDKQIFSFLEIHEDLFPIFSALLLVALFELSTQFIIRVNIGVLKGKHKYDIAYRFEAIAALLRLAATLLLLATSSFNIISFALCYSLSKIVADALSFYYTRKDLKRFRFSFDVNVLKELLNIGSSSLIISIAGTLFSSLPILLFGKFFGVEKIFLYSIPFAILIILSRLINTIYQGVIPKSSELKALGNNEEIERISSFGVKFSILLGCFFLSFFIIFGDSLLQLWLGNKVLTENDYLIMNYMLIILLIYVFLESIQKVNIFIYKSTGLHWIVTYEALMSVFLLYLFSFIFIDYLQIYVFSFALVFVGIFKYVYYKFVARDKIITYSLSLKDLLIFLATLSLVFLINNYVFEKVVVRILLFVSILVSYLTLFYYYLLNQNERETFKNQLFNE